jgi:hypothetical protein
LGWVGWGAASVTRRDESVITYIKHKSQKRKPQKKK